MTAATLVDTNVLIDVTAGEAPWAAWSAAALQEAADRSILVINPIIYSELAVGYDSIEELEAALPADLYRREALPWDAAYLAGRCFLAYRRRGGERTTPLPDFYIGAHAAVAGYRLLTRHPRRYRTAFPTVELVAPPLAG